jgi:hypothetical protein
VKTFLKSNPDIAETIERQIREGHGLGMKPQDDQPTTASRTDAKKPTGAKS